MNKNTKTYVSWALAAMVLGYQVYSRYERKQERKHQDTTKESLLPSKDEKPSVVAAATAAESHSSTSFALAEKLETDDPSAKEVAQPRPPKAEINKAGGNPQPGYVRLSDYLLPPRTMFVALDGGDEEVFLLAYDRQYDTEAKVQYKTPSCKQDIFYTATEERLHSKVNVVDGKCMPLGDLDLPLFIKKGDKIHITGNDSPAWEVTSTNAKVKEKFNETELVFAIGQGKDVKKTLDCVVFEATFPGAKESMLLKRTFCKGYGFIDFSVDGVSRQNITAVADPKDI